MKFFMSELRVAKSVKRGIAILFAVGGALRLMFWDGPSAGPEGPLTALLLASVGVGIFRNWRWARWMAMGACFLTLVCAALVPLFLLNTEFPRGWSEPGRKIMLIIVVTATFAYLAYKGLQYFRSDLALEEFTDNAGQRARMSDASSRFTLYSSGLWVVVFVMLVALHANYEMRSGRAREARLPDLVPVALCRQGPLLVKLEIENEGQASATRLYRVTYTSLRFSNVPGKSRARVPKAGSGGRVTLDNAIDQTDSEQRTLAVKVNVDASDAIRESNEENNLRWFDIEFRNGRIVNLPLCDSPDRIRAMTSLDIN